MTIGRKKSGAVEKVASEPTEVNSAVPVVNKVSEAPIAILSKSDSGVVGESIELHPSEVGAIDSLALDSRLFPSVYFPNPLDTHFPFQSSAYGIW